MEIKEIKDIYQELQQVRCELLDIGLKKTGENAYAKFKYFELGDFVPDATRLFNKHGMCPTFTMDIYNDSLWAFLIIHKGMEAIPFKVPAEKPASSTKTPNPIQEEGSQITYLRRYLYQIVLDLVETDQVDSEIGADEQITAGLKVDLMSYSDLLIDEFKKLNIKTASDLDSLTRKQAVDLIMIARNKEASGIAPAKKEARKATNETGNTQG